MPDDLFKSRAAVEVLRSYLEAKALEEETRKGKANVRLAIYHDDWEDILDKILISQFDPTNYAKIILLKNTTQNILKKVVNDVSVVYKVAPTRDYGDNETVKEIYDNLDIDEFMKRVNRYSTLLNDSMIRVGYDKELDKLTLDLQTPANTSVIQRDGYVEQAAAVYYDYEKIDDKFNVEKVNVFWSDFEHFLFDLKGNKLPPAEDNVEMINPYGKLPFVFIHMSPRPGMFWNPTEGNDLVNGTTINGMQATLKDFLFKFASFKQPVIATDDPDKIPKNMKFDPASIWLVTANGSVQLLDFTAAFTELDATMQKGVNSFLATYGLSVDMFAISGEEASGRALNIKNRGLREIRETQLPVFRRVESELFNMIRLVWNKNNPGKMIPETLEFKIDFAELETYLDPMDKRAQAKDDVKNGIISPAKYYMMFNPDVVDEVEAEKQMSENLLKYKNMKNQGFSFDRFLEQGEEVEGEAEEESPIKKLNPFNAK